MSFVLGLVFNEFALNLVFNVFTMCYPSFVIFIEINVEFKISIEQYLYINTKTRNPYANTTHSITKHFFLRMYSTNSVQFQLIQLVKIKHKTIYSIFSSIVRQNNKPRMELNRFCVVNLSSYSMTVCMCV